jgi:predicted molibdopterin-dependent oxidoreductase YjgC
VRRYGELLPATWDEALDLVARRFAEIRDEDGADALMGFSSARCTNEDNYVFQKFMRAVIGTHNVDHCARLCHASTVTGLRQSLGSGAMTNSFADLEEAEAIIIIGSNMRIKLIEALLDKDVIGVQIGESPINEDKYVKVDTIRDIISQLHF